DPLMVRYYELLSDIDLPSLHKVRSGVQGQPDGQHPMESKKMLARALVARFHDEPAAQKAEDEFILQFRQKEIPEDISVVEIKASAPVWICKLLLDAGLVGYNGEARRLIRQGGVRIDGEKIDNPD